MFEVECLYPMKGHVQCTCTCIYSTYYFFLPPFHSLPLSSFFLPSLLPSLPPSLPPTLPPSLLPSLSPFLPPSLSPEHQVLLSVAAHSSDTGPVWGLCHHSGQVPVRRCLGSPRDTAAEQQLPNMDYGHRVPGSVHLMRKGEGEGEGVR